MHFLLAAAGACLFSEFVGYWLHILLHSHRIEFLSRNHMLHHLIAYAPNAPQRPSDDYVATIAGRASLLGIGLEWVLPLGLVLAAALGVFRLLGVAALDQAVFVSVALAWGFAMFSYMHDALHLKSPWLERSPRLSAWFQRARRLHDVHHMTLSDDGTMPYNYGICFFLFDRLFGSLRERHAHFNQNGLAAARRRYAYVLAPR